jgi:hypothetical protein
MIKPRTLAELLEQNPQISPKDFDDALDRALTSTQRTILKAFLSLYDDNSSFTRVDEAIQEQANLADVTTVRQHISQSLKRLGFKADGERATNGRLWLVDIFLQHKPDWVNPSLKVSRNMSGVSATLEYPEGEASKADPFYLCPEDKLLEARIRIQQPGALLRIQAPALRGKTSFMSRVLEAASELEYRTAYIDLGLLKGLVHNLDAFLRNFWSLLAEELSIEGVADWPSIPDSVLSCTSYCQKYVLPAEDRPLVLGIDKADYLFTYPQTADSFFAMLRTWHENGKRSGSWVKLRLVIAHATDRYIPLNIHQSPFNVGVPLNLLPLSLEQMVDLAKRHSLQWSLTDMQAIQQRVGGHPYLVRLALYHAALNQWSLDVLLQDMGANSRIYHSHLERLKRSLLQDPDHLKLINALAQVVTAQKPMPVDTWLIYKLDSLGLITARGSEFVPSYELYRDYFRDFCMRYLEFPEAG